MMLLQMFKAFPELKDEKNPKRIQIDYYLTKIDCCKNLYQFKIVLDD